MTSRERTRGIRTGATRWSGWLLAGLILLVAAAAARAAPGSGDVRVDEWRGYEDVPLRINIWHDHEEDQPYRPGEAVRIHFETNRDGYAVVYRIDTEGKVVILWPRSHLDDGFVFGGQTYHLPTAGGRRIRAGDETGIEYVEAIFSEYPFDLRDLDIDFHEERGGKPHDYYVAGDPFLAMNEVNLAITGLDDPEDYVVTNYVSYSVGRQVDHPRYLCTQCHDPDTVHDPYRDRCTVEIHYDYGWTNDWYLRFGYYPVYYYPVYYYVDPWTWTPWVNFWYRPWYAWPAVPVYDWGFSLYIWDTSPYYRGDVWVRYKHGDRRYRPLAKTRAYRTARKIDALSVPRRLVVAKTPDRRLTEAMRRKQALARRDAAGRERDVRARYRNVPPARRRPQDLKRPATRDRRPGLRVPGRGGYPPTVGGGSVHRSGRGDAAGRTRTVRPDRQRRLRPDDRPRTGTPATRSRGERLRRPSRPGGEEPDGRFRSRPAPRPADKPLPRVKPQPRSKPKPRVKPKPRSGAGGERTRDRAPARPEKKKPVVRPKRDTSRPGLAPRTPARRPLPPTRARRPATPPARKSSPPPRRSDDGGGRGRAPARR